jgi:hypothetical protein
MKAILLAALVGMTHGAAGLTIDTFTNSGLSGAPSSSSISTDTTLITASDDGMSAFVYGTLTFPKPGTYAFDCTFAGTAVGFFWVDGHLLCQDSNTYNTTAGSTDNPLPVRKAGKGVPIRAHLYKDTGASTPMSLSVRWGLNTTAARTAIPASALTPELSQSEQKRDKLQQTAAAGWGKMLHHNILTFTRLPAGIALTPTVCQLSTATCIDFCTADGLWKKSSGCDSRVGPHAIDRSYGHFFFGGKRGDNRSFVDANVSVAFAAGGADRYDDRSLKVLIEAVSGAGEVPAFKKYVQTAARDPNGYIPNATRVTQTPTMTTPATTATAPTTTTPTYTQTVYDLGDDVCDKTGHKIATKIALSTSTSQHCVEVHNWGKVIATCNSGVLTYTLFDNDNCTGHSAGTRSWALDECVQGYGVSWIYSDCEEQTTPAAPPTRAMDPLAGAGAGNAAAAAAAGAATAAAAAAVAAAGNAAAGNAAAAAATGDGAGTAASDFVIRINSRFLWNRSGTVSVTSVPGKPISTITFSPAGLPLSRVTIFASVLNGSSTDRLPRSALGGENDIFVPLRSVGGGGLAITLGADEDEREVAVAIRSAHDTYSARMLKQFGGNPALAEIATAVEAAAAWTAISTPAENNGVLMPVSRGWSRVPALNSARSDGEDWSYAVFDWDNLFASLFPAAVGAKELAYSNIIQSFKSKTAEGYLANCAGGGYKDQDRSEPLVGAKVLLELYKRYNESWLVELLFDDALGWVDWTTRMRTFNTTAAHGLYTLRSFDERHGAHGGMQEARYESGLDNSPMYDCASVDQQDGCDFWDASTGTMQVVDVGMSSMAASEAYSLAELADAIGRSTDAADLRARADRYAAAIRSRLWDEGKGVYANLVMSNNSLSERISPTSFYPLLLGSSGKEDDERAGVMVTKWLTNSSRFCVGNRTDECYWGLPSIAADDDSYPALGYWRGFVWGPMAQLVHWSLQKYDHVPAVQAARKALATQMSEMFVAMWRLHGHVCENYLPHKNGTEVSGKVWPSECTGTTFYHWGALSGLIQLAESA